jgi:multiple sugar transport system ATP-binding protein
VAAIELDHLTKVYPDGTRAVDDLSLAIADGELVVFVGPSGCGKTSALRMVAGLEEITDGEVRVGGTVVNDLPPKARDMAMIFQNYALYPHMNVYDNIAFGLKMRGVDRAEIRRRVDKAADILGLDEVLSKRPRHLSGGQRQRVAMGRAIVREPQAFLMDEPLSNLDAQLRAQTRGELKRLQQALGTTTIHVTHDQAEAMTLGHRVAILRAGRIEQFGAPLELYRRPINRFVAGFLGSPAINILPASLTSGEIVAAGARLRVPAGLGDALGRIQKFELGVRPEDVQLRVSPDPAAVEARVEILEAIGNETIVTMTSAGDRIVARAPADLPIEAGHPVWFRMDDTKAVFFDPASGTRIAP